MRPRNVFYYNKSIYKTSICVCYISKCLCFTTFYPSRKAKSPKNDIFFRLKTAHLIGPRRCKVDFCAPCAFPHFRDYPFLLGVMVLPTCPTLTHFVFNKRRAMGGGGKRIHTHTPICLSSYASWAPVQCFPSSRPTFCFSFLSLSLLSLSLPSLSFSCLDLISPSPFRLALP